MHDEDKAALCADLLRHLKMAQALRRARGDDPLAADHLALKQWQADRLADTYRDLLDEPRYRPAAEFFLDELYGTKDFTARDAEVERIVPLLVSMLPARALATLCDALRMDALSEALDADMVRQLRAAGRAQSIDWPAYAAAYRASDRRTDREAQIALVEEIGHALDRLTHMPLLGTILKAMRKPAELAGLGNLQRFLQRGYQAFSHMRGADNFLATITARETTLMRQLFDDQRDAAR